MAKRLLVPWLSACLLGCALDPATPSTTEAAETPTVALALAPPPFAARARARERAVAADLLPIIAAAKSETATIRRWVDEATSDLPVPQRYATREPHLRRYRDSERDDYLAAVRQLYDEALARLDELYERSLDGARGLARAMAGRRSPLDDGPSGDPLLDRQLRAFEETLRMTLDKGSLQAIGHQRARHRIDKLEVFSSFTSEGADQAMGGRLMLFVGEDERVGRPLCDVVLRTLPGVEPADRGLFQVVRYRIMAGATIVEDLGWKPFPPTTGLPAVEVWADRYLIAPGLEPTLRTDVEAFDQLRTLRVVADVQTAVFDRSRSVLGGVDWRLEFRVSERGALSWMLSSMSPAFNPRCEEAAQLLAEPPQG